MCGSQQGSQSLIRQKKKGVTDPFKFHPVSAKRVLKLYMTITLKNQRQNTRQKKGLK
jgi:hypothetical protein